MFDQNFYDPDFCLIFLSDMLWGFSLQAYLAHGTSNRVKRSPILKVLLIAYFVNVIRHKFLNITVQFFCSFQSAYNVGGHCVDAYIIQSSILGIRSHHSAPVCIFTSKSYLFHARMLILYGCLQKSQGRNPGLIEKLHSLWLAKDRAPTCRGSGEHICLTCFP